MKWGIIGAGNIAKRFAQSQSHIENSCIYAISARNHEKREKFKETYGVQHAYSAPLEVLEDPQVEANRRITYSSKTGESTVYGRNEVFTYSCLQSF